VWSPRWLYVESGGAFQQNLQIVFGLSGDFALYFSSVLRNARDFLFLGSRETWVDRLIDAVTSVLSLEPFKL